MHSMGGEAPKTGSAWRRRRVMGNVDIGRGKGASLSAEAVAASPRWRQPRGRCRRCPAAAAAAAAACRPAPVSLAGAAGLILLDCRRQAPAPQAPENCHVCETGQLAEATFRLWAPPRIPRHGFSQVTLRHPSLCRRGPISSARRGEGGHRRVGRLLSHATWPRNTRTWEIRWRWWPRSWWCTNVLPWDQRVRDAPQVDGTVMAR